MPLVGKKQKAAPIARTTNTPPPLTIWIHGTRFFPKEVLKSYFFSIPGLHHYTEVAPKYYSHTLSKTLIMSNPNRFAAEEFYLFGWNGNLGHKERENAARHLYTDLKKVIKQYYEKYGCQPSIRIYAHSHGGNVALLLAKVMDSADTALAIDKLVLLATPVQMATKECVTNDIFKKVYSLYSCLDVLQVVDPQGLKNKCGPLFSERLFDADDKILQVQIKINDRSLYHIDFVFGKFLRNLTHILDEIDDWDAQRHTDYFWNEREKILILNTLKK